MHPHGREIWNLEARKCDFQCSWQQKACCLLTTKQDFFFHLGCVSLKKIQDWILKSERIRKRILCFFIKQINPRSLGSWCIKGPEPKNPLWKWIRFFGPFDTPWSERSWINLCNKETQNAFSDSFGFKNPILDFLNETHPYFFDAK